ncbi:MAG: hypothetical protein A3C43_05705 [Candidatus Schekmanbacteria bacterium RIFCSPHIGHO2_02_FULL_38_11]|uniref:histidine kinase n=1 Tax=Candidatus Schekmanbacteria bacterium RIFCSPLOWO2_12_FULL_38_15 TaxID=1817883 RepID=A0A1F7SFU9_9BACT|nr:MAG: hypothetical protein A3H37_06880 [Candidatus Schekmanbacteria bacterium RIFCSPLOWO2_02_FULL_38_14]OGL52621.1 MAG: hypothetical protein A3G31_11705 [Candidatus Schekmanbacteria bacterium RIFCSPLOWO2_12_FULL_38_15]OGL55526.1 MAG: hypothetical protein A3C43_05705 [Candidatus Schekmanbacteria bacterium RIFCSPHIGHO2_02_FULL_38_11]
MTLILFISIILHVFLGTFVYFKDRKALPNKIFGLWMLATVLVGISTFCQGTAKTAETAAMANPAILGFAFIFTSVLILLVSSIYYPRFISTPKYVVPFMVFAIVFPLLPLIDYCAGTNLITKGVAVEDSAYVIIIGEYRFVILTFHAVSMILMIFLLSMGFKNGSASKRKQIVMISIAYLITFMTLSVTHSISNQLMRRIFVDSATLTLTLCFTYFIIKHRMFSPIEAGLGQAIRNMRDGLIVLDKSGRILKFNQASQNIFGFTKDVLNKDIFDFFSCYQGLSEGIKAEETEFDYIITNPSSVSGSSGSENTKAVNVSKTRVLNDNNEYCGSLIIAKDITKRKRMEKEIVEKKEFLEKVIETSADGIVITHKGGIIINVNKAIKKLVEREDGELIGEHIGILNPEGNQESLIEQLYKTGYISNYECKLKTKSGNYIPVEGSYSLLYDKNGEVIGSVCMMRDIRQRKELESQILQTNKLAAIGELAAGVAHELNNPLAGILGYSQLINQKIEKKGIENIAKEDIMKIVDYHKCIEKESIRCKTIVQNLLKFSRKSKVEFGFVDINTVLDEAVTFTEHQLQLCNVKLIKNLDEGVPEIYGNSAQLQQVFTNMIINAKKAMSEGGTLSISSKYINGNGSGVDMVKIEFSDTGCGIAPEHLGKIFDPFFTTRKIGEGTGLGLSISYGIVKEHHGDIKVESEHNKGTVFTICLPAEQKNTSAS